MARKATETGQTSSRRKFLASAVSVGAVAVAGCTQSGDQGDGGGQGDSLSGNIKITGSSTVYPLASRMSELFEAEHSDVSFSISPTGSGAGFSKHFCKGNSMMNNASRPITQEEAARCSDNGVNPIELRVATDAITVIVNNNNDWVECMTVDELEQIWTPDDPAQTWSDVNSDWPDEEINLFGAADTSGTFDYFTETVVGEGGASRTDYSATEKDNQIVSGVANDEYALGYLGFAYYDSNRDLVTALEIDDGDGCVAPSLETAKSGEYSPLSRPLFTYPATGELETDRVAEFCRFFLEKSSSTQIVAEDVGYVPNTEDQVQSQLEDLNAAIENANSD